MNLEDLNASGWMQARDESSAACRHCGALVASSEGDHDEWTERHVAWHMSLNEF
jgi:hypothetical protein